jgi:glutathione S-transferase
MKLYYAETLNPRKACAVAKYLNAPVDFVRVELSKGEHKSPAYLAINPNGKVPTLTDGDTKVWESHAIMAYLARHMGSDLWPADERQIEAMRWLSWSSEHFTRHAGTLIFQNIIKPNFLGMPPDTKAVEEATTFFRQFAQVLNDHLHGRRYLLGDTLTIADFSVAAALPDADRASLPVREFPEIERWHARLNELPAWREPFPTATKAAA